MTDTEKFEPRPEAWDYFMKHHDDIRSVVSNYLPIPRMQIPNTRVSPDSDERASQPLPVEYTVKDFDKAVKEKDTDRLYSIMNSAWLRAPEDRGVYGIPGFTEMCNLLDCTVDGFFDDDRNNYD